LTKSTSLAFGGELPGEYSLYCGDNASSGVPELSVCKMNLLIFAVALSEMSLENDSQTFSLV
jgi:hypothetical protein